MKRTLTLICASTAALATVAGGCGSGSTRTVSVSSSTPASTTPASTTAKKSATTGQAAQGAPTSQPATAPSPAAPATPSGGTAAPSSGGSSHEPAFVGQGSGAQGMSAAVALMRARGYAALDPGQYRSDQTLRVLVGARNDHVQQAFFFVGGRYLGTDTSSPSAKIRVVGQNDTQVTLAYSLYHSKDPACCPSGGEAQVRYQLDNGRLVALDPIPSVAASAATAGRQ